VAADPYTGLLSVLTDAAAAFDTSGRDVSGDNLLYKLDPATKTLIWTANLTAVTQGRYGGFQDVEHDVRGNTYVVGSWASSILRVDAHGAVTPWYVSPNAGTDNGAFGYAGLAAVFGTDILLVNDNMSNQIFRFNMSDATGNPTKVSGVPNAINLGDSDAIYLPPKYNGTVLLVANDLDGTTILRSKDNWVTAEQVGNVWNNLDESLGGFIPANIEIAGTLYSVQEFFSDGDPNAAAPSPGNRTDFPLVDITPQVERMLAE